MPQTHFDRNAVVARVAVREGFADEEQVRDAQENVDDAVGQALGDVLVSQGVLAPERRCELEQLVDEEIDRDLAGEELTETIESTGSPDYIEATEDMLPDLLGNWSKIPGRASTDGRGSHTRPKVAQDGATNPPYMAGRRYLVQERHDEGALGRIMRAHDRELNRQVALKEMKPGVAANPASRDRFLVEAEVTGGLEHPSIVPVYSLGSYEDDRPYYVMRFIRGNNLGKAIQAFHAADNQSLDPGQRLVELHRLLRRFIDVCHAIQYAHSRGILHRDLKPGNIMLGKFGETLVVDWGLAKIIGRDGSLPGEEPTLRPSSGSGTYATMIGSVVGTPSYMSPEQAGGEVDQLTAASDIYGLGATLYCVLTGRAPFKGRKGVLEKVRRGDFPPPREVKPEIDRPLEAICLKAMRLEPEDRYATAGDMIADLEAWIAEEPVSVYQENRRERLARWMRRNRNRVQAAVVALSAVTVIAVAAALLVSKAWQSEAETRREAQDRFSQAISAVDKWTTGVGEVMKHYPAVQGPRKRLLEAAVEDYELLTRGPNHDLRLEVERGRGYLRLGHVLLLLEDGPGAERAYRNAIALFQRLLASSPTDVDCQTELGNAYTDLGVVLMAIGKLDDAHKAYSQALEELRPLVTQTGDTGISTQLAFASALVNRAELYAETGHADDAEPLLRECIDTLANREFGARRSEQEAILVRTRDILGRILIDAGRFDEAAVEMNDALDVAAQLVETEWDNPEYLELKASAYVYLASAQRPLGRWQEEAEAYRNALADYIKLNDAVPNVPSYQDSLGLTLMDLGSVLYKLGDTTEAQAELDSAFSYLQRLSEDSPSLEHLDHLAYCQSLRAQLLRDEGQLDQAVAELQKSIATYEDLMAHIRENSPRAVNPAYVQTHALCLNHLALTLLAQGDADGAMQAFDAAVASLSELATPTAVTDDKLALIRFHRGIARFGHGEASGAAEDFAESRKLWTSLVGAADAAEEHRYNMADFLVMCPDDAFRDAKRALALIEPLAGQNPENADYRHTLAMALYRDGQSDAALSTLAAITDRPPAAEAADSFARALAHASLGDAEKARQEFELADGWLQEHLPHHPKLNMLREMAMDAM